MGLNFKGLYRSSKKKLENYCLVVLCSRPPQKSEIRQFHVVVGQRRQRNVQKSVMHVQRMLFSSVNLNQLLFCSTSRRLSRGCLKVTLHGKIRNDDF